MSTPASVEAAARACLSCGAGEASYCTGCLGELQDAHAARDGELQAARALLEDAMRNIDEWTPEWIIWRRAVERHMAVDGSPADSAANAEAFHLGALRAAGCRCEPPLAGYRPGVGPRCRLCNRVADVENAHEPQGQPGEGAT